MAGESGCNSAARSTAANNLTDLIQGERERLQLPDEPELLQILLLILVIAGVSPTLRVGRSEHRMSV
jgi:hypothetical protein